MRNLRKKYDGWALVTGASSGIGKEMACELARQKFDLILVARNGMALEQLSDELVSNHDVKIRVNAI